MTQPPELLLFGGDWEKYLDNVYEAFLETFVRSDIQFQGCRVTAPYRPESKGRHFSFWHVISEAPHPTNRNEEDRLPDLRRCERIRWIAWAIRQTNADDSEVAWWENTRGRDTHVVIWAKEWDFAVILGKRRDYYVLKTAYCSLKSGRRQAFEREKQKFWKNKKTEAPRHCCQRASDAPSAKGR